MAKTARIHNNLFYTWLMSITVFTNIAWYKLHVSYDHSCLEPTEFSTFQEAIKWYVFVMNTL